MTLRRIALATLTLALATAGCSKGDATTDRQTLEASGPTWTQAEITEATGNKDVTQIYEVPKDLPDDLVLAYINPSLTFPFFKSMSDGQKAAADFYDVEFYEADLGNFDFADVVNKYNALSVHEPTVVGTLTPSGEGLLAKTKADGVLLLPSGIPIPGSEYFIGTPERETGLAAGKALAEAVKQKQDGDWKDKPLNFVGLGQAATPTTMERVEGGLEGLETAGVTPDHTAFPDLGKSATVVDGQRVMADYLTAHPNDAIAVVAMNDESGIGALQAVQRAGRQEDVQIVTIGGGEIGRAAFERDDNVIAGQVDLNPYATGWRWVEAAIAISFGDDFEVPAPDRVITRDNVDEFYPEG